MAAATSGRMLQSLGLLAHGEVGNGHAVELPVTFEGGAGTSRAVSPEEVRFATDRVLGVGERIGGVLRFPPVPKGALEVRASFERLEFVAGAANR